MSNYIFPIGKENKDRESVMQLKNILKKLIKEHEISVAHLSRKTKVPLQTLHGWLSGNEPKSIKQVKIVADYFQVDLDYICFGIAHQKDKKVEEYQDEINAGVFEVILKKVKK